ncbi:MAG TPA: LCP family protein, partial [Acidimicrobiales bacterium]|nr:LCP family protein [Acidimicrobiales bacterium]
MKLPRDYPLAGGEVMVDHPADPGLGSDSPDGYHGRRRARVPHLRTDATRHWPRRVLVATNIVVAVMLIAAGSVYRYVKWRFGQINRVTIPSLFRGGHSDPPGQPMTILIVGSDTRAGISGSDAQAFGNSSQVAGQRSDTIMLVHVDPKSTKATLMSIPRDLWVQIPGKNYKQRINTTFDTGADLLVQAIKQDL